MEEMRIQIFNPENDLALAFGGENYTPPPLASRLRSDFQLLPLWYSEGGDYILCDNVNDRAWVENIADKLGLKVNLLQYEMLAKKHDNIKFIPWGWSADTRKRLIDRGVSCNSLPTVEQIVRLRDISHRSSSIIIHNEISNALGVDLSPKPIEMHDFSDICNFARDYPACFIKSPWSSSGKGIFRVLDVGAIDFERWCRGILRRQGSIMCEQPLDKIMDFAMEFYCKDGVVRFKGYSVFNNDSHCSFDSGIVSNTATLHQIIVRALGDEKLLLTIRSNMEKILTNLIGNCYEGYLGVDMLLYKKDGKVCVNPCVELNMRMTMGALTSIIGEKYIKNGSIGEFKIEYHKSNDSLSRRVNELAADAAIYESGKISGGNQILTPIYAQSQYLAYIAIKPN